MTVRVLWYVISWVGNARLILGRGFILLFCLFADIQVCNSWFPAQTLFKTIKGLLLFITPYEILTLMCETAQRFCYRRIIGYETRCIDHQQSKLRTPSLVLGTPMFTTALISPGGGSMSRSENIIPKYPICCLLNSHFGLFKVRPYFFNLSKTIFNALSWSKTFYQTS